MKIKSKLIILFLAASLSACSLFSPQPEFQKINWPTRQQQLTHLHQWDLKGVIGVRTASDTTSATIHWNQGSENYTLLLFGPLGVGRTTLLGNRDEVVMQQGEQTYRAATAEHLLLNQLGLNLPVSNLYYWIRGLPVPNLSAKKQFDDYNHLVSLQQQNWKLQYSSYINVNNIDLPQKIQLSHPDLELKMVIKQWII